MKTRIASFVLTLVLISVAVFRVNAQECDTPVAVTPTSPYTEGFEDFSLPTCWQRYVDTYNCNSWSFSRIFLTPHTGECCAYVGLSFPTSDLLCTPWFNLSELTSCCIEFWQMRYSPIATADSLEVLMRTSPTAAWQSMGMYTGVRNTWERTRIVLPVVPGSCQVAFRAYNGGGEVCCLDDFYIGEVSDCDIVEHLTAVPSTGGNMLLSWVDTFNVGATYNVSYWDDAGDTVDAVVNDTSLAIGGLGGGTMYHFSVTTDCGDGSLSRPCTVSMRTAPDTVHIPYVERFHRAGSQGSMIDGWTILDGYAMFSTYYGDDCMNIYTHPTTVLLPPIDQPVDLLQMRFMLTTYNANSGYRGSFSVGYMTDSANYVWVATWDNTQCYDTVEKVVRFAGAPSDARIVMRSNPGTSFMSWYVDNVVLELIPDCTRPMPLSVIGTTDTTITLAITDGSGSYRVYWTDGTMSDSADVYDTVYTIHGLYGYTLYTISVRSICGDGSLTPPVNIRVRTQCGRSAVPFVDDFDSYGGSVNFPICWDIMRGNAGIMHTGGSYGSSFLRVLHMGSTNVSAVALPRMDASLSGLQVGFWLCPENSIMDSSSTFSLGYTTDAADSNNFVALETWTAREWTSSRFVYMEVTLSALPANARLVLRQEKTSEYLWWMVDSVTVEYPSSCPRPTSLSLVSVGQDRVKVHVRGNSPGGFRLTIDDGMGYSDTIVTYNYRILTFVGLSPLTTYTITAVADCGTELSRPVSLVVTTLDNCDDAPATMPYYTGFETDDDMCWRRLDYSYSDKWAFGMATAADGSRSMYISDDNGISNHHASGEWGGYFNCAYKTFWLDSTVEYVVSYDWKIGNCGVGRVLLLPSSVEMTWYTIVDIEESDAHIRLDGGADLPYGSNWQTHSQHLTVGTSGYYNLVFCWINDGYSSAQPPLAIDNVMFAPASCPMVRDFTVVRAGRTDAHLRWTPAGNESEWELVVDGDTLVVDTCSVLVNGLQSLTTYNVSVRPICGEGDTGLAVADWFSTALCPGAEASRNYWRTQSVVMSSDVPFGTLEPPYSYAQMIIPASNLNRYGRNIRALSFKPNHNNAAGRYSITGVDVYMANVPEDRFESDFIRPDSDHRFVKVISDADFSFGSMADQLHPFDSAFNWDGYSNVLVAMLRKEPATFPGSNPPDFDAHMDNSRRSRFISGYDPIDVNTVSGGSTRGIVTNVQLFACPSGCVEPYINDVVVDDASAVVYFQADDSVEVCIAEGVWDDSYSGTILPPNTSSYTFTGLEPQQHYYVGVRRWCGGNDVSQWVVVPVITLDIDCQPPVNFTLGNGGIDRQVFRWTPVGSERAWQVHIFNASRNSVHTARNTTFAVDDLYGGTTYYASVRSLCGLDGASPGPWGDTLTFTTEDCPMVQNVTVSNITGNSAVVNWDAVEGSLGYRVYYGMEGFYDVEAMVVDVGAVTRSLTLRDLNDMVTYEVMVLNRCTSTLYSGVAEGQRVAFTTMTGIEEVEGGTIALYPNPADESVTLKVIGLEGTIGVQVVDINGRENGRWQMADGELTIDVSHYAPGAYFVRLTNARQTIVRKLIVR